MFKYTKLYIVKSGEGFCGLVGTPTGILTAYKEELCVGDTIEYFFGQDRHDVMSGVITKVNGRFKIDGCHEIIDLYLTRIIKHYMDLKIGDKIGYGLFEVKKYEENMEKDSIL